MVGATDRCRVCDEPLMPGATFCPHCGARVEDAPDYAAMTGRVVDEEVRSRRMWVLVVAIVALIAIAAVVLIALATTSGGGGGNPPSTSLSPSTPETSTRSPGTTTPATTRPPVTTSPR